jgi:stage II sporulation protein D
MINACGALAGTVGITGMDETWQRIGRVGLLGALLIGLVLMVPGGCQPPRRTVEPPKMSPPIVRVRLLEAQESVTLTATAPSTARAGAGDAARRVELPLNTEISIRLLDDGWRVGETPLGSGELVVLPGADGSVSFGGRAYRGHYRLVPAGRGTFDLVNHVDIDSYLKSVIPREMFPNWHDEAYKAQAIAARTYALYEVRTTSGGKHWDLHPDTRSQVYGGVKDESAKSRSAVDHTAGLVLAYGAPGREKIFKAYFSACCGGISQSAYDAFGDPYIEPLSDQNVGSLCNVAPRFNWGPVVLDKDELTRRIRTWGASKDRPEKEIGRISRIDIQYVNRFGRPIRFLITDESGKQYSLGSEETRWACNAGAEKGAPRLNSSFFKTINEPNQIQFVDGHGHGHGAGMCQWCTQVRATRGIPHEAIVLRAYPRSVLVRAY